MQKTAIPRWFRSLLFLISLSLLQITVLAVQKTETPRANKSAFVWESRSTVISFIQIKILN